MMIPIYGSRIMEGDSGAFALSFDPIPLHPRKEIGGNTTIEVLPEDRWEVVTPDDARLERDEKGMTLLSWPLGPSRKRSTPNEVIVLADLGLHGFRFTAEDAAVERMPLRVEGSAETRPWLRLPYSRLDQVRQHLDAHGIRYWVSENVISFNGAPPVTTIYMYRGVDPKAVQAILDGIPGPTGPR